MNFPDVDLSTFIGQMTLKDFMDFVSYIFGFCTASFVVSFWVSKYTLKYFFKFIDFLIDKTNKKRKVDSHDRRATGTPNNKF